MKTILSTFLSLGLLVTASSAQAQQTAMEAVIAEQIEAFKVDDFDRAFTFASPTIQGMFGTSENFGMMVRQGYPMVWRPADVQFLQAETRDGALWQDVMIRDAQGRTHILGYQMIEGEDGWKINAVQLRRLPRGMV